MRPFRILPARTVEEAVAALAEYGDRARPYAGGTELLLLLKQRLARLDLLVDVKKIPGLSGLCLQDGALVIGAATTHREVERSPLVAQHLPLLREVEAEVANVRVRHVGTVGGNLAFAEPHSDLGVVALLLGASLEAAGPRGARRIPAASFLKGAYTTDLAPDEILTRVAFPLLPPGSAYRYLRFQYHERPSVAVGVVVVPSPDGRQAEEVRIAVGCAGPVPVRAEAAEARLAGCPLEELAGEGPAVREAAEQAAQSADPRPDFSGSAEYKAHLVQVYVRRALRSAAQRLLGGGRSG